MSVMELLVRVMAQVQPLLPYMIVVAAATALVLSALLLLSRGLWVDQRRFRTLGLFFDLDGAGCLCLACAWIRLVLLVSYLAGFCAPDAGRYLLFLAPGMVCVLLMRPAVRLPLRLLRLVLEGAALLSCNLMCAYIRTVYAGMGYVAAYVVMAVITALFGIYLFLTEAGEISAGRRPRPEHGWKESIEEKQ